MPPEKIDSLADDVKPLVLELLRQISGLTARGDELVAQNKALLLRIAELEVEHGKRPKTRDNSSLPPSRGQKGNVAEPTRVKKARKGRPGAARALAENPDATRDIYAERCACGAALAEAGQELARAWDHVDLPHKRSKSGGGQGDWALARMISGRWGTAWAPGTTSRSPR